MRRATLLLGLALLAGCVTETQRRTSDVKHVDELPAAITEEELLADVEESPDDPAPYFRLGRYYEDHRRYERALAQYLEGRRHIREDGIWTGPDYLIGKTFFRLRRLHDARQYLESVISVEPADPEQARNHPCFQDFLESHYLLGCIAQIRKRYLVALEHFDRVVELAPYQAMRVEPHRYKIRSEMESG